MQLDGRVAVVTGGASGIGAALAATLAGEGMHVAVADLDASGASTVADAIRAEGGQARGFGVEVGDRDSMERFAGEVAEAFGPASVVCANVGVVQMGRLDRVTEQDWDWVFRVNVHGTVQTVERFLPQVRTADDGHFVITASCQGVLPVERLGVYSASKAAVLSYAEVLRAELAEERIGVTTLLPGPVATNHLTSSDAAREGASNVTDSDDVRTVAAGTLPDFSDLVPVERATRDAAQAIRENWKYWVTHPPHQPQVRDRFAEILDAFERSGDEDA
jgi:NAD(P)-dependent dehydrogenase (short-subunit alcohol dehydrogenase family)